MEVIIYVMFFIIGILLGSFFTLAIYRIPLKQDITHTRSYCPKCNHKLGFFDLIPIFSYLFLKGKCRYCKSKINARYVIIETFSGLLYLLFVISLNINIFEIEFSKVIYLFFGTLYYCGLFIIGGIDRTAHKIPKGVLIFLEIIEVIYITYLCAFSTNTYRYIIYFFIILLLTIIKIVIKERINYPLDALILCIILQVGTGETIAILSIVTTLIWSALRLKKYRNKDKSCLPIGAYLCFSNIVILIISNLINLGVKI